MPVNKPTITGYKAFYTAFVRLHDEAVKQATAAVDDILKQAYREMGRLIVEQEQKGGNRAGYGEHLLEKLSADLTASNRKGFSVTNLKNMRKVYLTFQKSQTSDFLTWSHLVTLASVEDEQKREALMRDAIRKQWSVDELKNAAGDLLDHESGSKLLSGPGTSKDGVVVPRLAVKRGLLNIYRIVEKTEDQTTKTFIDCGFFIYHRLSSARMAALKDGQIIHVGENGDEPKVTVLNDPALNRSVLFTFEAYLNRIIDADTIVVHANCGFKIWTKQKLRLRRLNAPEIKTPAGQKAKAFVARRIKAGVPLVIKTYSTDIFDRYLVDVFYMPGEKDPAKIAAQGILLNQELIDAGHAQPWVVPDPDELAFLN